MVPADTFHVHHDEEPVTRKLSRQGLLIDQTHRIVENTRVHYLFIIVLLVG